MKNWREVSLSLLLGLCILAVKSAEAQGIEERLNALIGAAPKIEIGVEVLDLQSGQPIFSYQSEKPLKPASVLKVATTAFALEALGPEYRFSTGFSCSSALRDGVCAEMIVKGSGDPDLTIESLWNVTRTLRARGLRRVDSIALDAGRFVETKQREGQRAYQTGSSALSFNHNSLAFHVCPTEIGRAARVAVEPREASAVLSGSIKTIAKGGGIFAIDERSGVDQGLSFFLSGNIGVKRSCEIFYRSVADPEKYFAQALRGALIEAGIATADRWQKKRAPAVTHLLFEHKSPSLHEIVHDINRFSNNFIAEQVLFRMGNLADGRYSRQAGLDYMRRRLLELGFKGSEFKFDDGSGLSHENLLSAKIITRILLEAWRSPAYGPEFIGSLSRAGLSGTLRERSFGLPALILRGKTGTLDGVSSLAGYLYSASGRALAFTILVNRAAKGTAQKLEDNLVRAIYNFA